MDWFSRIIVSYGGAALFLVAFVENLGVPFPALPVFVIAGAVASRGETSIPLLVAGAVAGAVAADFAWYLMGRWRGRAVLATLCRISLNPDVCVERAETGFHHHRVLTILFAKFLPGVNTVMPPLAGIVAVPAAAFLALDALGSLVWASAGVGLGFAFGAEVAVQARNVNAAVAWGAGGALGGYLLWRIGWRLYLVRYFSVPRVEPDDLHRMIADAEGPLVLDLRNEAAYAASGATILGARRYRPSAFGRRVGELPRDREIVLFCT